MDIPQTKPAMDSPAEPSSDEACADAVVSFSIQRLGAHPPFVVSLPLGSTLGDLKEGAAKTVEVGPFAFKFITADCSVLTDDLDKKLDELGLHDGATLTMITESARDYSKITSPERVLKTGQYPNGIFIDKDGNLYATHYYGELKVYNSKFQELRHSRTKHHPRQATMAPSGELVIAFDDGVHVFNTMTLEELRHFGNFPATGVAVEGGLVYASNRRGSVNVYRFDGEFVGSYSPGLNNPQALAVVEGRLLAVADRGNDRILLLNIETLEVESQLPPVGAPSKQHLSQPNDVIADSAGNLLVMDTGNERIAVFRADGTFVGSALDGFFKNHGNTYSYLSYNSATGAFAVSNNDEHCITVFSPIFKEEAEQSTSAED